MLNLGFDLDSVIARTSEAILDALKKAGVAPQDYAYEQITTWNMEWDPVAKTGVPGVTFEDMKKIFMTKAHWEELKPYLATVALVNELYRSCGIYIITDRCWFPELQGITAQWLKKHGVKYDQLIIAKGEQKWQHVVENKVDFFVDDRIENILSVAPYVRGAYLFAQPWNYKHPELPENAARIGIRDLAQDLKAFITSDEIQRSARVIESLTVLGSNGRNS